MMARSIFSTQHFQTTTSRSTVTMAMRTLPTSAIRWGSQSRRYRFSAGARLSSTTTTMAGSIYLSQTDMCIPKSTTLPWGTSWKQRPLLFHNNKGKLELVPAVEGTSLAKTGVGRGLAFGDLFNDGKIDAIINNMDGTPSFLRNVTENKNHWVELKLVGGPKSPRDAVGATVYLKANGFRQRSDVVSGGSFASSSDQRLHFGLGSANCR
jgi:hypothetical protein